MTMVWVQNLFVRVKKMVISDQPIRPHSAHPKSWAKFIGNTTQSTWSSNEPTGWICPNIHHCLVRSQSHCLNDSLGSRIYPFRRQHDLPIPWRICGGDSYPPNVDSMDQTWELLRSSKIRSRTWNELPFVLERFFGSSFGTDALMLLVGGSAVYPRLVSPRSLSQIFAGEAWMQNHSQKHEACYFTAPVPWNWPSPL